MTTGIERMLLSGMGAGVIDTSAMSGTENEAAAMTEHKMGLPANHDPATGTVSIPKPALAWQAQSPVS